MKPTHKVALKPGTPASAIVGTSGNVGDRVFFETDSTELTPQARTTLDKQAQWLSNYGQYAFTVEGHADEVLKAVSGPDPAPEASPKAKSRPKKKSASKKRLARKAAKKKVRLT